MKRLLILLTLGAIGALGLLYFLRAGTPNRISSELVSLQSLQGSSGYARADQVRTFQFPLDHGPHPDYQTEWWYYTGNLESSDGRAFGYQLTFFRRAISPTAPPRDSNWATSQIYFAHFAITDVQSKTHSSTERFSRGAAGLAGATGSPFHVWLENWEVNSLSPEGDHVQLHADDGAQGLTLNLVSAKPPVLHGEQGLSQKADLVGDASYYYSFTRLFTAGTLTVNGSTYLVKGLSWMDHEFGTTELGPDAAGWDWFSIQLGDGREVMFFQIRQKDGSIEPRSGGTLVEQEGKTRRLSRDQVQIRALDHWTSSASGASYPSRWSLSIPSAGVDLTLTPLVADQEMHVSITYWEGAVAIEGTSAGAPVKGKGYVEMTGYAALP